MPWLCTSAWAVLLMFLQRINTAACMPQQKLEKSQTAVVACQAFWFESMGQVHTEGHFNHFAENTKPLSSHLSGDHQSPIRKSCILCNTSMSVVRMSFSKLYTMYITLTNEFQPHTVKFYFKKST